MMINLWRWILSLLGFQTKYTPHDEAVIIACFYNPEQNKYRTEAFKKWYASIQGLNYKIVELLIGPDAKRETPVGDENITVLRNDSYLWHKEALLNYLIQRLPTQFKYVFWVDVDLIFTNKNWLVESVDVLKNQGALVMQPFEYCIHLEKGETKPSFNIKQAKLAANEPDHSVPKEKRLWRSFCATHLSSGTSSNNYDRHGHVGFAWGARRSVLDVCSLFDHALVGGADHIIAHAIVGELNHVCITKAYKDDIDTVTAYCKKLYSFVLGEIGFAQGDVYHLWHGNLNDRQYFKRVIEFTKDSKNIVDKDENGLYVAKNGEDTYVKNYYHQRDNAKIQRAQIGDDVSGGYAAIDYDLQTLYMLGKMAGLDQYHHDASGRVFNDAPVGLPDSGSIIDPAVDNSVIDVPDAIDFQPINPEINSDVKAEVDADSFQDFDTATFS